MNNMSVASTERITDGVHVLPVRVYYEDTDAAGIVYYADYLKFTERARTEVLRDLGFDLPDIKARQGVEFAVRRCNVDYIKPAFLDDLVEVHTKALAVAGASFELRQSVLRGGETLVVMDVKLVCLKSDGRPGRLPKDVRSTLKNLLDKVSEE